MSLTSYRAAPPRDEIVASGAGGHVRDLGYPARTLVRVRRGHWPCGPLARMAGRLTVNGFVPDLYAIASASKPGDDLLFHCLSTSTIGAVWFHGRVRDGIGWVTDAMATKLWSWRNCVDLGF